MLLVVKIQHQIYQHAVQPRGRRNVKTAVDHVLEKDADRDIFCELVDQAIDYLIELANPLDHLLCFLHEILFVEVSLLVKLVHYLVAVIEDNVWFGKYARAVNVFFV